MSASTPPQPRRSSRQPVVSSKLSGDQFILSSSMPRGCKREKQQSVASSSSAEQIEQRQQQEQEQEINEKVEVKTALAMIEDEDEPKLLSTKEKKKEMDEKLKHQQQRRRAEDAQLLLSLAVTSTEDQIKENMTSQENEERQGAAPLAMTQSERKEQVKIVEASSQERLDDGGTEGKIEEPVKAIGKREEKGEEVTKETTEMNSSRSLRVKSARPNWAVILSGKAEVSPTSKRKRKNNTTTTTTTKEEKFPKPPEIQSQLQPATSPTLEQTAADQSSSRNSKRARLPSLVVRMREADAERRRQKQEQTELRQRQREEEAERKKKEEEEEKEKILVKKRKGLVVKMFNQEEKKRDKSARNEAREARRREKKRRRKEKKRRRREKEMQKRRLLLNSLLNAAFSIDVAQLLSSGRQNEEENEEAEEEEKESPQTGEKGQEERMLEICEAAGASQDSSGAWICPMCVSSSDKAGVRSTFRKAKLLAYHLKYHHHVGQEEAQDVATVNRGLEKEIGKKVEQEKEEQEQEEEADAYEVIHCKCRRNLSIGFMIQVKRIF